MAEWHLTPTYILYEMTEELLALMFEKRNERLRAIIMANNQPQERTAPVRRVSDVDLFKSLGITVNQA